MIQSEQQRYGLKICENELLLLGVFIGKNQSQCNELNWRGKINKGSAAKTYNKALIGQPCLIPFLIEKYLVKKPLHFTELFISL
jgi:hypothetical protein